MKKLQAFIENGDYVIRRINQFGTTFERRYSKQGFIEAIQQHKQIDDIDKIEADQELGGLINKIKKGD